MAEARTASLRVVAGSDDNFFPILADSTGARQITFQTRPYQPGDPVTPWRIPVHPWDGGLYEHRLYTSPTTYSKANADASYPGVLQHPPATTSLTLTNSVTPSKMKLFNNLIFFMGGRYMYYFNPADDTVTEDEDFGVGNAAVDMEVYEDELVVAMGETVKLYTRNTAGTYTQATDNTFAIALGLVDDKLFRAASSVKISSAITAPRTLASWAPSSGNEYEVGESTWDVNGIIDYQGALWAGKADGVYHADPTYKFRNQTPQLRIWPHVDNCKGMFTAHGALWVPSVSGLYRIRLGSSLAGGPEVTFRPDYRFWIRGGVEFGKDTIYMLATDEAAAGQTVIIKALRDPFDPNKYTYHEWCRLGAATKGYAITVTTVSTNPKLVETFGNNARYQLLGRAGGKDTDDPNYLFNTSMELESGMIGVNQDLSVVSVLQGCEVTLQQFDDTNIVRVAYKVNNAGNYAYFYDKDTNNNEEITSASAVYKTVRRYVSAAVEANVVEIKVESTIATTARADRTDIREVWIFGYSRPKVSEIIRVPIVADGMTWTAIGLGSGKTVEQTYNLFRDYMEANTVLECELYDYAEDETVKFVVVGVTMEERGTIPGTVETVQPYRVVNVDLARLFAVGLTS